MLGNCGVGVVGLSLLESIEKIGELNRRLNVRRQTKGKKKYKPQNLFPPADLKKIWYNSDLHSHSLIP